MLIKKSHSIITLSMLLIGFATIGHSLAQTNGGTTTGTSSQTTTTTGQDTTTTSCAVTAVGDPTEDRPICESGGQRTGNFVYYCQLDPQWNDDAMWGGSNCLLGGGCGPTSLAMVLSSFGVNMTPKDVDAIFKEKGWRNYCNDGSSYGGAVESDWFTNLGMTVSPGLAPGGDPDLEEMNRYISEGYLIYGGVFEYPCLGCVTSGSIVPGHVIVIDGIDIPNKRVHVRDPNNCKEDSHTEKTAWGWVSLTDPVSSLPDTSPFPFIGAYWNEMYAIKKK